MQVLEFGSLDKAICGWFAIQPLLLSGKHRILGSAAKPRSIMDADNEYPQSFCEVPCFSHRYAYTIIRPCLGVSDS